MLEDTPEIIAKIMIFVIFKGSMHNVKELFLSRVVDLSDFRFDLTEPIFDGIQLRRIRR